MIYDHSASPAELNHKPNRWDAKPLCRITGDINQGTRDCHKLWEKSKFNKMSHKAHSERRGCHPVLTYNLSFVTNEIHSSLCPPSNRSVTLSTQMDVSQQLSWGQIWSHTWILLPLRLLSSLDWVIDAEGYTFSCFCFIPLMPPLIHTRQNDCCAVCLVAAFILYVIHSYLRTWWHDILQ